MSCGGGGLGYCSLRKKNILNKIVTTSPFFGINGTIKFVSHLFCKICRFSCCYIFQKLLRPLIILQKSLLTNQSSGSYNFFKPSLLNKQKFGYLKKRIYRGKHKTTLRMISFLTNDLCTPEKSSRTLKGIFNSF